MTSNSFPTVGSDNQNLVSIAEYLMANGFSQAAAAGVAGTSQGEGGGDPESVGSGGAGLIGWTPPSSARPYSDIVTGNRQQDFDHQLVDIIQYADSNSAEAVARGGVDLATLEKATDPVQAGAWWSAFEGPLVPGSDERQQTDKEIYQALNGYKPNSGWTTPTTLLDQPGGGGSTPSTQCVGIQLPSWLGGACLGAEIPSLSSLESDLFGYLERFGLFVLGGIFIIIGLVILFKDTGGGQAAKSVAKDAAIGAVAA